MDGAHLTLPSCTDLSRKRNEQRRGPAELSMNLCPVEEADKRMGVDLPCVAKPVEGHIAPSPISSADNTEFADAEYRGI